MSDGLGRCSSVKEENRAYCEDLLSQCVKGEDPIVLDTHDGNKAVFKAKISVPDTFSGNSKVSESVSKEATEARCSEGKVYVPHKHIFMNCGDSTYSSVSGLCFDSHEVTNKEFGPTKIEKRFVEDGFDGENQPVVYVTFQEASAYCIARGGRLPTKREWLFAAAAAACGTNFEDCKLPTPNECFDKEKTCDVKTYPANELGLFDILGNVREWTYDDNCNSSDRSNPVCGESWLGAASVRSLSKICDGWPNDSAHEQLGFRCIYPSK